MQINSTTASVSASGSAAGSPSPADATMNATMDTGATDKGDLLKSIAVLKEILKADNPSQRALSLHHASLLQHRYEEHQELLEKNRQQERSLRDFAAEVESTRKECHNERSMRKTLQDSYDSLVEHRKALQSQLDVVIASRDKIEARMSVIDDETKAALDESAAKAQDIQVQLERAVGARNDALKKLGAMEAQLQSSVRTGEEIRSDMEGLQEQLKRDQVDHQLILDQHEDAVDVFKRKIAEAEAEHDQTKQELEALRTEMEQAKNQREKEQQQQQSATTSSEAASTEQITVLENELKEMTEKYNGAVDEIAELKEPAEVPKSAAAMFDTILEEKEEEMAQMRKQLETALEEKAVLEKTLHEQTDSSKKRHVQESADAVVGADDASADAEDVAIPSGDSEDPPGTKRRKLGGTKAET